jgi:hypothetical protein
VASILLERVEIKHYAEAAGPEGDRPSRPQCCPWCDATRIWFNGWRLVFVVVLTDGAPHRFDEGLWLQKVKCAGCRSCWTLRPSGLYPHRSLQPDVTESAALAYLSNPEARYRSVAARYGCSVRSVWRWVGWSATLAEPAALVSQAARLQPDTSAADIIPKAVPEDHPKARSVFRAQVLLVALQVIVAMVALRQAQPHPPDDPSALGWWLTDRFLRFREVITLTGDPASPRVPHPGRGPPR